jgi:hypothetical protein
LLYGSWIASLALAMTKFCGQRPLTLPIISRPPSFRSDLPR